MTLKIAVVFFLPYQRGDNTNYKKNKWKCMHRQHKILMSTTGPISIKLASNQLKLIEFKNYFFLNESIIASIVKNNDSEIF